MAESQAQVDIDMASEVKEEDYSQTVRNLHNEMVTKLDEEIAPCDGMRDTWNKLLILFSNNAPLSTRQIRSIKNIGDLFALLMTDNYISFGNYEEFTKKLQQVHKAMASLVRKYSDKINDQIAKDNPSLR